jgi:hypothetical protein
MQVQQVEAATGWECCVDEFAQWRHPLSAHHHLAGIPTVPLKVGGWKGRLNGAQDHWLCEQRVMPSPEAIFRF